MSSAQGENRFDGNIKAIRWGAKDLNQQQDQYQQSGYIYTYNDSKFLTEATYGEA